MKENREFIQVENLNGEIEEAELICRFKIKDSDKLYALLTTDKVIGEEVNVNIGYLYEENGQKVFELVEDEEELNYIYSLLDQMEVEE